MEIAPVPRDDRCERHGTRHGTTGTNKNRLPVDGFQTWNTQTVRRRRDRDQEGDSNIQTAHSGREEAVGADRSDEAQSGEGRIRRAVAQARGKATHEPGATTRGRAMGEAGGSRWRRIRSVETACEQRRRFAKVGMGHDLRGGKTDQARGRTATGSRAWETRDQRCAGARAGTRANRKTTVSNEGKRKSEGEGSER